MGFGTLFFGYFLLLNIFDFYLTDLVMSLVLLFASVKLSSVSREFKNAMVVISIFTPLAAAELIIRIMSMFGAKDPHSVITSSISFARYVLIALFSFFALLGIEKLARELELKNLRDKAVKMKFFNLVIYLLFAVMNFPFLEDILPATEAVTKTFAIIGVILLAVSFISAAVSLIAIYGAYMHICMPEDLVYKEKPSKFGFVNKFREYEEKKQQEYQDYKLKSMSNETKKKKKKK